jgi:hypothetical protein
MSKSETSSWAERATWRSTSLLWPMPTNTGWPPALGTQRAWLPSVPKSRSGDVMANEDVVSRSADVE